MDSEKEALPKGMSYPLKPSFLAQALDEAGINLDAHLRRSLSAPYFRASFWPPNPNVSYERLYMTLGAVPSEHVHEICQRMESQIVPEMIRWIQGIISLPPNSPIRRETQEFSRFLGQSRT